MERSKQLEILDRARRTIVGGVNSPVRSFRSVGMEPIVVDRADKSSIWDADGNRFDDYVLSWGPMLFGHNAPSIVEAVQGAIAKGTSFGMTHGAEADFAELFLSLVPEMEMIRCVNSGTEATMSAIRLARGYTGRDKIVKFVGCYHGHGDSLLVSAGSGLATLGIPGSPGIPEAIAGETLALPFNDAVALQNAVETYGDQIAGVILETIPGNMGMVRPQPEFLDALRSAQAHGALLICDEVMTGFRVETGAAFRLFGLDADLTTWGKVIGAGLPFALYAGKAEVMQSLAPVGPVYQAGTLSGNPLAIAAGIAIARLLESKPWEQLHAVSKELTSRMSDLAQQHSVPFVADYSGSMFGTFFAQERPTNFEEVAACDHERFGAWFRFAFEKGILLAPSGYEASFLSTVHTAQQIDDLCAAFDRFLETV